MAVKTKKRANVKETISPMQQYIQNRMMQMNVATNAQRPTLTRFTDSVIPPETPDQWRIDYNDEERERVANKFKRMMCSLRALSFLYSCYADGMQDHAAGLVNMGLTLRKVLNAFQSINAKLIDVNIAINRMVRECQDVVGISGLELDDQNDSVVRGVFEIAMNCDAHGNQLDQEYVLVKMPRSLYNTTCIANAKFR